MKRLFGIALLASLFAAMAVPQCGFTADKELTVLFLTKSQGYEHEVIHREKGQLGFTEKLMVDLGKENGLKVIPTKDAGLINADTLPLFDVVMLYTTGDLCQGSDKDMSSAMSEEGREALLEWVKNGGALVGTHTATDTFHGYAPYTQLIGAEFARHGQQQEATITVKKHPITSHLPESWKLTDEFYCFKNVTNTFTPLMIVHGGGMIEDFYKETGDYPIAWIEEPGKGRVFASALGHRKDVWENPAFQQIILKAIKWTARDLN
ncbi:MAG: hypothetical protein GC154_05840 [bacterium]|nr:hypothetical protein [bacterium]